MMRNWACVLILIIRIKSRVWALLQLVMGFNKEFFFFFFFMGRIFGNGNGEWKMEMAAARMWGEGVGWWLNGLNEITGGAWIWVCLLGLEFSLFLYKFLQKNGI